tara:strand:+ start:32 stop:1651 length:1620 start_codon:yes stop_codon:yes gene_type:complete
MEDPLKIYNDILSIALEEFVEDEHPRKDDGKFAKKEDAGDDAGADDTSFTKIGGSKNNTLDSFIKTDNEEPEIEYMDDNEIAEDEKYMDYLARMGGFQNTQYVTDGVKDGIPYTSTLDSLSEDSQRFEYMIRNHTPEEQTRFRQRRFKEWKDNQIGKDGEITSDIRKNYSNRFAVDSEQLFSSIKSYAKYNDKKIVGDYQNYSQLEHQIEDGLKGSFTITTTENNAEIRINLNGFSPDGVAEKDSEGNIKMHIQSRGVNLNNADFDEFIKKNDINLHQKSVMDYGGTIKLNARDVNNIQPLMPFITQQLEKNKFKIREQKKNYNKIKEAEDKLSDLFNFTPNETATKQYNLRSVVEAEGDVHGTIGETKNLNFKVQTTSGSDPTIYLSNYWDYERDVDRGGKRNKLLEGIFGDRVDRTVKEIEEMTPIVLKQIEEADEITKKLKELETLQNDTTKKHKEDLSTIHTSYNDSKKKKEESDRIMSNLHKKTDLHKKIEPELEPEFEDIGDEEITNDDIGIGYDPRKINLDDIDLDDSQAYA